MIGARVQGDDAARGALRNMKLEMPNIADASPGQRGGTSARQVAAFLLIFLVAIVPVLTTPILPTIDFYNHVARYFVLSRIDTIRFLAENYQGNWSLLPNIGMDVLGVGLMRIFPPTLAPHILTIASMLVQFSGVMFFSRQMIGRWSLITAVLLVPLLYSYIFVWGFANFLLGLGLAFWAAGWWLARRDRLALAVPVACLFAVAIFLCHGLAFALYGLLVGALELAEVLAAPGRRAATAVRSLVALSVQAVAPVAMFMSTTTAKAEKGITSADESVHRLIEHGDLTHRVTDLVVYRLQTIVRVAEGPSLWFDIATFILTIGILAALAIRGRARLNGRAWPAIAVALALVALAPPAMFGVGYVADRMPLFLAFIVAGSLDVRAGLDAFGRFCLGLLLVAVAARLIFIGVAWRQYAAEFTQFREVAGRMAPGSLAAEVNVTRAVHVSASSRCEMYGPLMVVLYGQAAPLFADPTQQPLRIVGPLRQAGETAPSAAGVSDAEAPAFYSGYIAAAAKAHRFRYLLICGAERLAEPLPDSAKVIGRTPRFTLLDLKPS